MRYEKKMLILSGEGKGVVLIEKSGLGVKFALRTFGLKKSAGTRAGIITAGGVFVRELPDTADPSAVFYIDDIDVEGLHFAVFDSGIRLYGATGKRLWDANLLDLFKRHVRPLTIPEKPQKALPPLVKKPETLPLPDGRGIVQKRDAIYGDEAISAADFYTPFDISERLDEIDGFLDTPRVLTAQNAYAETESDPVISGEEEPDTQAESDPVILSERETDMQTENDPVVLGERETDMQTENDPVVLGEREAAAAADAVLPWEREAEYIRSLVTAEVAPETVRGIRKVQNRESVRFLREAAFFERCQKDIDKLFAGAQKDGELSALLPDIEWVRVEFDGHYVSVGRGSVFLCYAVPGLYDKTSPLGEEAQWLPKLKSAPTGKGYWLIFQDMGTGEIISG